MKRLYPILVALCLLPGLAWAQMPEPRGKVIASEGTAVIERPGLSEPIPVDVGFELFRGDWFVTGETGGAKLLMAGQLVVFVGPNTYLRVDKGIHNLKDRARVSVLTLKSGTVRTLVRQRPNYSHTVRLETSEIAVSGSNGYCLVSVDQSGITRVYDIQGTVRIKRTQPPNVLPIELTAGRTITAEPHGPFGSPLDVDAALAERLMAGTEMDNTYIWNNRPGSLESLVERTERGSGDGAVPSAQGLLAADEGEGGANFDAFSGAGLGDSLRQEDLPRPGFTNPNLDIRPREDVTGTVRVRLKFPETKKNENDED
jgi:hypothetical protein